MEKSAKLEQLYTEKGSLDLKNRLKTLIRLFNENKDWNKELIMLGFGKLVIEDREECFGRIKELSDILMIQIKLIKTANESGEDYQVVLGD
jgi:hypothetical protein